MQSRKENKLEKAIVILLLQWRPESGASIDWPSDHNLL